MKSGSSGRSSRSVPHSVVTVTPHYLNRRSISSSRSTHLNVTSSLFHPTTHQMSDTPEITQPLHPSILPLLDPDYRAFHEANLLHFVSPHLLPWSPAIRDRPAVPGGSEPLKVAAVKDFKLTHTSVRTFTPFGTAPEKGWPAFVFFHGGEHCNGICAVEDTHGTTCRRLDSREY